MKYYIKTKIGILLTGLMIVACNSSSQKEADVHEEEGPTEAKTVSLSEQQMDAIGLKLVQIKDQTMNIAVQSSGKLELAPQDRADISPVIGGIVKKLNVFEGDRVRKGHVLATLEHPDFIQLQQDYINNLNNLQFLEKEHARQKKLYEENVGSGRDFQRIQAEYNNSVSNAKAMKVKLGLLGLNTNQIANGTIFPTIDIVAPVNGTISLVETNMGAYVEPLSKIFEIVDNDKIHADLMVYEKDINKISVGQKIIFTTSSLEGKELEGEIFAISPSFEDNPKAVHVHAKINSSKKGLIPGMYIEGRIIADNILTSVLPDHSIVQEEGKTYIFIKTSGTAHDHDHEKPDVDNNEHNHSDHDDDADNDHMGETADEHHEEIGTSEKPHEEHEEGIEDDHGDTHVHDDHEGPDVVEKHHEGHEEGKWTFQMLEIITGVSSGGFTEIKLLSPLPEHVEIAGTGAYYLLAEMGKGETEHSH